ncbi:MAG: DUF2461 domain-containing protein [Clostridiaceae bacterium]
MNMETILDFLTELEQNNNRDWYHANKQKLARANQSFEELIRLLMLKLKECDSRIPLLEPKDLTFKLVRDTRFSHDKAPYNPAFRAHISSKGKLPIPVGCYIMIKPGNRSFLGGGLFADMFKNATAMVRDHIVTHGDEWQQIISAPAFTEIFTVKGTALKNMPNGYDPAHPQAEYIKNKSWYLEYPVSDQQLLDADFISCAAAIFIKMQSFNSFLNEALDGFQMPAGFSKKSEQSSKISESQKRPS